MKRKLSPEEIQSIDLWLNRFQFNKNHFHFGLAYREYEPLDKESDKQKYDEVYDLLAHHSNVLEYDDAPLNTFMRYTEKGLAILEAGGYKKWEEEEHAAREYQKQAPYLQKQLTDSTVKTNYHLRRNMWIVAGVALLTLCVSYFQFHLNQEQLQRDKASQDEIEQLQRNIRLLSASLDSLNHTIIKAFNDSSTSK